MWNRHPGYSSSSLPFHSSYTLFLCSILDSYTYEYSSWPKIYNMSISFQIALFPFSSALLRIYFRRYRCPLPTTIQSMIFVNLQFKRRQTWLHIIHFLFPSHVSFFFIRLSQSINLVVCDEIIIYYIRLFGILYIYSSLQDRKNVKGRKIIKKKLKNDENYAKWSLKLIRFSEKFFIMRSNWPKKIIQNFQKKTTKNMVEHLKIHENRQTLV